MTKLKLLRLANELSEHLFRTLSSHNQTEVWRLQIAGYVFVNHAGIVCTII